MSRIPGLPPELEIVPPAPSSPDDELGDAKRKAWNDWKSLLILDNDEYQSHLETDTEAIADEMILCGAHPAYWLARWGWIFEPRPGKRQGGEKPFIPFAVQVDLLDLWLWCLEQDDEKGDAVVSKSRDMGASWLMCALAVWGWLFKSPWQVRMYSYVQDLVDKGYNKLPDSLFWKCDFLMDRLPAWMMPTGYSPENKNHRTILMIVNPQNGNLIAGGSSTGRAGRAGRATWVGFDEYAMFEEGDTAYSSTANTTDHRFPVSSEHIEYGDHFQRLWAGNDNGVQASRFAMDWWQHPGHDREWYDHTRRRFESEDRLDAFSREVERNAYAGNKTWVYRDAWDKKNDPAVTYNPLAGDLYGGMDPGFRDKCALVWGQDDPTTGLFKILDAYQNKGMPADYYASVIKGTFESGEWQYDLEAERIMGWTATLERVTWYGDAYGHNITGATTDSVYSRLARKGVHVNRDRLTDEEVSPFRRQARTHRGRQEAVREMLPRLVFADTPGARIALKALQQYRYSSEDTARMTEAKSPMHDWASHLAGAIEYMLVNIKMRRTAALREYALPTATKMGAPKSLERWAGGVASQIGRHS